MELAILLPIAAFIALVAGLAVVLRGTGRIVARTRDLERFKSGVGDLVARVDASLSGAATQIDAVRRRQIAPNEINETIVAATDAVTRYTAEAQGLQGPSQTRALQADLVSDLQRAGRALEMVEHGAAILVTSRGPRELEAQTSIKRGYLNLIHAREAIARHAIDVAQLDADDGVRTSRWRKA